MSTISMIANISDKNFIGKSIDKLIKECNNALSESNDDFSDKPFDAVPILVETMMMEL